MKSFKIINDPHFARSPIHNNQPDYKILICSAYYHFYKDQNNNIALTETEINNFLAAYYSKYDSAINCIYYLDEYIELYQLKYITNEVGYSLVTREAFPLKIYPYSNSSFNGIPNPPRTIAFKNSIADLNKNLSRIINAFERFKNQSWEELQHELQYNILHYPRLKKAS